MAVQEAGAFAVLLECVPSIVAKHITELLKIPTIGIGAGPETSGQVLVFHDLMGMLQHPHHAQHVPKFCKRYASVGEEIRIGLEEYREDVENRRFPNESYSPYKVRKPIAVANQPDIDINADMVTWDLPASYGCRCRKRRRKS